jgi:hypothetical protein
MSAPRILPLTLAAFLAAAAVACGSNGESAAPPSTGPGSASPTARAGGSPIPDRGDDAVAEVLRFSAPRLGGGTIEGEDLAGQDVAFWFWAPW